MNRQEKQLVINNLRDEFNLYSSSFIIGTQGLTVEDIQSLKKELRLKGAKLKVAKNTLLKRAIDDKEILDKLAPYFKNQVAIVFVKDDVSDIAKIIRDISQKNSNLSIVAGSVENKVLNKEQVEYLASLPSKDILRAKLIATIKSPLFRLVNVLNQPILKLALLLNKIADNKKKI